MKRFLTSPKQSLPRLLPTPPAKRSNCDNCTDEIIDLSDDDVSTFSTSSALKQQPCLKPLAERLRPQSFDDFIGQPSLNDDSPVRQLLGRDFSTSILLSGPPGTGKTTIGRIISSNRNWRFVYKSAKDTKVADVRLVFEKAKNEAKFGRKTLFFLDEVHAFNKSQQDVLLEIEKGNLVLMVATTENPIYALNNALRSRLLIVKLTSLSKDSILQILDRAIKHPDGTCCIDKSVQIAADALNCIAEHSSGDARAALNLLEAVFSAASSGSTVQVKDVTTLSSSTHRFFDKSGDLFYNTTSAFIKSMRACQTDAALYYLMQLVEGGADPLFIARRLIVFASEDIGIADSSVLNLCVSSLVACQNIGLPECKFALVHATISCSEAPKSRDITDALKGSSQVVEEFPNGEVPLFLRNVLPVGDTSNPDYRVVADSQRSDASDFLPVDFPLKLRKVLPFYRPGRH
ncbi:hypothetical protein P9112_008035 [Eukaryota sp. TZLM1-RC]